jgi:hypothetical protein
MSPAPDVTEIEKNVADAQRDATKNPRLVELAPEIPSGKPIVPPPPASTFLPEAILITAVDVVGTPQQRPSVEEAGAASTSAGGILVTPPKSRYAVPTELVDDPMLTSDVLKYFQDTYKELYKFSTLSLLSCCDALS